MAKDTVLGTSGQEWKPPLGTAAEVLLFRGFGTGDWGDWVAGDVGLNAAEVHIEELAHAPVDLGAVEAVAAVCDGDEDAGGAGFGEGFVEAGGVGEIHAHVLGAMDGEDGRGAGVDVGEG